jgi:rhodanese-related sulfurtransferase
VPSRSKLAFAGTLLLASLVVMGKGQPSPAQKFELLGAEVRKPLEDRSLFVHPAEVVALRKDLNLQVGVLDLRDEHDFNLFHLGGARRVDPAALVRAAPLQELLARPASSVTFLVGNGEERAVVAWKELKAAGVGNLYVVEGGIDRWLELYGPPACVAEKVAAGREESVWRFAFATGATLPSAWPELQSSRGLHVPSEAPSPVASGLGADHPGGHAGGHEAAAWPTYPFTKKVKLQSKAAVKGGCG